MRNPKPRYRYRRRGSLLWFLLVGWWLGIAWACVAVMLACTIVGLGAAFEMLEALPFVMTLR